MLHSALPEIGPYRLIERLGAGGMGAVFKAFDKRLEREVALKQVLPESLDSARARLRFRREAKTAAGLNHPAIVRIHDLLTVDGTDWIVMELVEGSTLAEVLERGPLPFPDLLQIAASIAEGLAFAHGENIVHRDLKARNIIVLPKSSHGFRAKILDFGLSKPVSKCRPTKEAITLEGQIVGTPQAMSPEQAMGLPVDQRSDLFAFGALLYEMATAVPPFRASTVSQTLKNICASDPPKLSDQVVGIPESFSDLVRHALNKSPEARPRSTNEMVDRLRQLQEIVTEEGALGKHRVASYTELDAGQETLHESTWSAESLSASPDELRQVTLLCSELIPVDLDLKVSQAVPYYRAVEAWKDLVNEMADQLSGTKLQTLGDRTMLCFGYPKAQEDAATRAVGAAEELRWRFGKSSRDVLPRSAIHTAVSVVRGDQQELHLGPQLDVPQRLLPSIPAGGIWMTEATQKLIRGQLRLLPCEPQEGATNYKVFQLESTADSDLGQPMQDASVLVAREAETAWLTSKWQLAADGRGQVALLSGEAGIGKTRLIQAFLDLVSDEFSADGNPSPMIVQGDAVRHRLPFQPVVELLKRILVPSSTLIGNPAIPSEARSQLRRHIRELGMDDLDQEILLASFLGLPSIEGDQALELSPKLRREKILFTIEDLFRRIADQGPVLLWVEDLQWIDPSSLELLGRLVSQTESLSMLIILTGRPEAGPPWLEKPLIDQLRISRLTTVALRKIIDQTGRGALLPKQIKQQIAAKADGVPLFAEELTLEVLESDILRWNGEGFDITGPIEEMLLPATLVDSLNARLDRLGSAKTTAQLAATLGREFSFQLLAAVSRLPDSQLRSDLHALVNGGLLLQKGFSLRLRYSFRHALIRDAAYGSLLKIHRERYHRDIATTLEGRFESVAEALPEMVAHHWASTSERTKAVPWLQKAGFKSRATYANEEALGFFQRAVDLVEYEESYSGHTIPEDVSLALHEQVGELMTLARQFEPARRAFQQSLSKTRSPVVSARLHRKIGDTLDLENVEGEALNVLQEAERVIGEPPTRSPAEYWREWIEIQWVKRVSLYRKNDQLGLAALIDELRPVVDQFGTSKHRVMFLETCLIQDMRRERYLFSAETEKRAQKYLNASVELGDLAQLAETWCHLGMIQLFGREQDYDSALSSLSTAIETAQRIGDRSIEGQSQAYLSITQRRLGLTQDALETSLQILNEESRLEYKGVAEGNLAWAAFHENQLNSAMEHGRAAEAYWQQLSMSYPFQWTALFPLLATAVVRGEPEIAAPWAERLLAPGAAQLPEALSRALDEAWSSKTSLGQCEEVVDLARSFGFL